MKDDPRSLKSKLEEEAEESEVSKLSSEEESVGLGFLVDVMGMKEPL